MQVASYSIDVVHPGDLVSATLAGFFNVADVAAYADEIEPCIRTCVQRHGQYRMLLDVSRCAIQSQDVIAAFIAHVQNVPVAHRSAVVIGSSIVRMQIRRVMDRPNVALFATRTEALAWVNERALRRAS